MSILSVDEIKVRFKIGLKVELIEMLGEKDMPERLQGTVVRVDDIGNIHVNWDNGRTLALIYGEDKFKVLG